MSFWTIVAGSDERTFENWGLSELVRSRQNLGMDTVSFLADGRAIDADELFAYGSTIIVYRDRVKAAGASTFSGGKRWFYGRIEPWARAGSAEGEAQAGACVGPWWYLANRVFRQSVVAFVGYTVPGDATTPPITEVKTYNHVLLNFARDLVGHPTGKLTIAEQIREALQWAITCGDPIAIGNIDGDYNVPIDEAKNITNAEVLHKMYRWCLDAVGWWDYSTTPYPTFHFRRQANLTPVLVDLNAGTLIQRIRIKPRPDWQRPYVLLQFEQDVNGNLQLIEDRYPDPIPAGPPPNGLETTVDLKGWSFNQLTQSVQVTAFNVSDAAWWKSKLTWLADQNVQTATLLAAAPYAPALIGRDGNPWNTALVNELTSKGEIADWMTAVLAQQVRATAYFDVTLKNGSIKTKVKVQHDFTATNATTRVYQSTQVTQEGDPIPTGLAQQIWTSLQALGAEGSITLTDEEVPETVDFGNKLNFTSLLRPEWSTLNAIVQQIDEEATTGSASISFGAPQHLTAGELVDLLRVARQRLNTTPFAQPRTGLTGGGSTQLPDQGSEANSLSGSGHYSSMVTSDVPTGEMWQVKMDAPSQSLVIHKVNAAGTPILAAGRITAALSDVAGKDIKMREWLVPNDTDGTCDKHALFLSSEKY